MDVAKLVAKIPGFKRESPYCLKAEVGQNSLDAITLEVSSSIFGETFSITQRGDPEEFDRIYLSDKERAKQIVTFLQSWINAGDSMYADQDAEFKVDNLIVTVYADMEDMPKVVIEYSEGDDPYLSLETIVEVEELEEALGKISDNFELNYIKVNEEISIACVPETLAVTIFQDKDGFVSEIDTYRPDGVNNLRNVLKTILA